MTIEQRHALRRWLDRAATYKQRYPDAPMDEVRAAVRAMRNTPLDAEHQLERICAEVRRQHHQENHL